jgi:predicted nucleic acid-binding protein
MKIECFLDTNVLIYAATAKQNEPRKYRIAYDLVLSERFCLSAQVLAEFYASTRNKPSIWLPLPEVERWFDLLARYPTTTVDAALVRAGVYFAERYNIRYYDGAILAAAERLGAPILYTEDLNHDQTYGSVRVVNPFRAN